MRARLLAILAYGGAAVSLLVAACTPFFLTGVFTDAVARTGVHVDAVYTGGTIARTVARGGYTIATYEPVRPHALQKEDPFVQIAFQPVDALPRHVSEAVDLDGDGQADVRVSFMVPTDAKARPTGEVVALNGKYRSFRMPGREFGFSELMARSGDEILVRVPMSEEGGPR
jgi:hypothetical protein